MTTVLEPFPVEAGRMPLIAGARNLRDLGGYRTAEGQTLRWAQIYRSGSLAQVTPAAYDALRTLGLRGVCDLRTSRERQAQPYSWCEAFELDYWCRDYETSFGELRQLLDAGIANGAEARAAMISSYRKLPFEQAAAYREIFARLAQGRLPLVFGCSAGKDRAGIGAALILTALGVPRETVIADYVLTDTVVDLEREIVQYATGGSLLSRQSSAVVRAILGCDAAYIAAALDAVAPSPAAFDRYLHDTLGVDATALASIRHNMLESSPLIQVGEGHSEEI